MNPEVHLEVQFTSVFSLYLERPTSLPCDFILFHLLKKTLSGRRNESRNALGSEIY